MQYWGYNNNIHNICYVLFELYTWLQTFICKADWHHPGKFVSTQELTQLPKATYLF